MKKVLLALLTLLFVSFMSGCNISDFTDLLENKGDGETTLSIQDESYKVYQKDTTLVYSDTSDEIYNHFVFKIGEVARVPIAYYTSEYHSGITDTQYTWTEITVSSSSLSETETELTENTVSSEIGTSIKSSIEAGVGASEMGMSAYLKSSIESELSSKLGAESKITNSNENRLEILEVQESRKEKKITIDKYSPKGHYWYAICTSCDIYVALVCDKISNTYEYCIITTSVGEKYDAMLYSGERDRLTPNIEEKLNFDTSIFNEIELFGESESISCKAVINLEPYIDTTKDVCSLTSDFSGDGYEYKKSEGILYLYGKDNGKYFDSFKLVGNYGKLDNRDHAITTIVDNLSIKIDSSHDLALELERLVFKSNNSESAISCSSESNKNITVDLVSIGASGENEIRGGQAGNAILNFKDQNLKISGNVPLKINVADGFKSGADGIRAKKLILDFDSSLTVEAGDGKDGSDGAAVSDNKNGLPGSNGGNGGHAINVTSLEIVKCYMLKL